jgi:hypothetical protein
MKMNRLMLGIFLVLLAAGCQSRPLGPYVSPSATGRVFAADTRQPLADVKVTRGTSNTRRAGPPLKGAELLMLEVPVLTDQDGRFTLACERVLSVLRGADWDTVSLSFDLGGYRHFHTNCPAIFATRPAGGKPVLDMGAIYLEPNPKSNSM